MVEDALVVHGVDFEPRDARVLFEESGGVVGGAFYEDRVVVCLHGDGNYNVQQEVIGHIVGLRDKRGVVFQGGGKTADRRGP